MDNIPEGYCQCGCGTYVGYWTQTNNARGRSKGAPKRWVRGHAARGVGGKLGASEYRAWWAESTDAPYGHCWCGCGGSPRLARTSNRNPDVYRVKGEPMRYIYNHVRRQSNRMKPPNPSGLCMCGCGEKTSLSKYTSVPGKRLRGHPVRYIHGHSPRKSPHEYLEQDRGFATPCWIWQRHIGKEGYGRAAQKRGTRTVGTSAHRVLYEREKGAIPQGLHLDHLCRVRACVNPDHMEPVTPETNHHRGALSKLNKELAAEIRVLSASGVSYSVLAGRYNVGISTIWRAVNHLSYRP